jgi:hypothetical protein
VVEDGEIPVDHHVVMEPGGGGRRACVEFRDLPLCALPVMPLPFRINKAVSLGSGSKVWIVLALGTFAELWGAFHLSDVADVPHSSRNTSQDSLCASR